jgi:NTP pyrophosphatase (non-canonical NTP hydrolase)
MDIHDLTQEMHRFVAAKGWYAPDSPRPQTPRNLAASLAIEAAEVLEHYQWDGAAPEPQALAGELADVALYLLQLASVTGTDLEQAILEKLQVNYEREWPPPPTPSPETASRNHVAGEGDRGGEA